MNELEYYCRDCDSVFTAGLDENGLEQAPCPNCQYVCQSREFEEQDMDRMESGDAAAFGTMGCLFGGLFGLLFAMAGAPKNKRNSIDPNRKVVAAVAQSMDEADALCEFLDAHDIEGEIKMVESGGGIMGVSLASNQFHVLVNSGDLEEAKKLIESV